MQSIPDSRIRESFLNVSLTERRALALPADLERTDWSTLDYLGWRDPKQPLAGHVVGWIDGEPVGVLLRRAERTPASRAQCSWCDDVQLPNEVVFFAAKRAGAAGRRGDSLGTLVCSGIECSRNVRRLPPSAYLGFDREAARLDRIAALRLNVEAFLRRMLEGA